MGKILGVPLRVANKTYNLHDRVRLFHAVVTPCALYGCGSWALTQQEEQQLKVTQRKMLRAILSRPRLVYEASDSDESHEHDIEKLEEEEEEEEEDEHIESWSDWLKRTTEDAIAILEKVGAEDWVTLYRKRKWLWAGKVCRHSPERWTSKVMKWKPQEGVRSVGHPKTRWEDQLNAFSRTLPGFEDSQQAWQLLLKSVEVEEALLLDFVAFCET